MKNSPLFLNIFSLVLAVFIFLPSSCKKDDEKPEEPAKVLKLGVILPMDLEKGTLRANAFRTAIDQINEAGGVGDGYTLEVVIGSSEGSDRRVAGIVEDVAIPGHIPCISGSATSKSLTGKSLYFHRLCPPDGFEADVLAQ